MGGGDVDTWHDRMYVHCTLVTTYCYFNDRFIIVFKYLPHATIMQFLKKSNMVDYICMYDVYKLPYGRCIFNSFTTTIQLTNFLT